MTTVAQYSPFSCALTCFESLVRDLGLFITQAEILQHHRDLCALNPDTNKYGALDLCAIRKLAERYLLKTEIMDEPTKENVSDILSKHGHGILIGCYRYEDRENAGHCIRAIEMLGDNLSFLEPNFPFARRKSAPLGDIRKVWCGTFIHIYC